jgi:Tol biopolymer transport system component
MRTHDDDELAARLRAAIDALPASSAPRTLPTGAPRRRAYSIVRVASALALSAVTLVAALVAGSALTERRASMASASPAVSASDRYGLIVPFGGPIVRSEEDPTPIARLYDEPLHRGQAELPVTSAVSPDGRRVAYWIWGSSPPGLGSLALTTLALFDGNTGTTRELLRLANEAGSGVVWSTDGTGLLVGVLQDTTGSASGATLARLRTFDLATGKTEDVGPAISTRGASGGPFIPGGSPSARADPGSVAFRPLLWDRRADRVAGAMASGNPNYTTGLIVMDRGAAREVPLDGQFLTTSIVVSPDGTTAAGARTRDFALVAWPLADYAARTEIVPTSGERILSLWWRPRTDQLYFIRDNSLTGDTVNKWSRLEVWRPWRDAPRIVDPLTVGIMFRFDGSAYFRNQGGVAPSQGGGVDGLDLIETDSQRSLGRFSTRIAGTLLLPQASAVVTPAPSAVPTATLLPVGGFSKVQVAPLGSAKGDFVFATRDGSQGSELWAIPLTSGGAAASVVLRYPGNATPWLSSRLSPNGRRFAFEMDRGDRVRRIAIADLTTGSVSWLRTDDSNQHDTQPAWDRSGERIAFVRTTQVAGQFDGSVWVVNVNGTGLRQIVPSSPAATYVHEWTADGRSVAFYQGVGYDVVDVANGSRVGMDKVVSADASWRNGLPALVAHGWDTVGSGDQQYIFVTDDAKTPRNVVVRARSTNDFLSSPRWRPGGDEFLYVYTDAGAQPRRSELRVRSLSGGERTVATEAGFPVWSPDGSSIVYVRSEEVAVPTAGGGRATALSNAELRIVDADGRNDRLLYRPQVGPGESTSNWCVCNDALATRRL